MSRKLPARRWLLPAVAFVAIAAVHYVWKGLFPEQDPAQSRWLSVGTDPSWLRRYVSSGGFWLGYSYALSVAFAVAAFQRYRAARARSAATLAIGGVTLTGVLAFAGCFLIGCCGSPMLAVYLSLFGAAFLPFAKPLVAGLTTVSLALGWRWMVRRDRSRGSAPCGDPLCACAEPAVRSATDATPGSGP
jgi:hypothetical protein